MKYEELTGKETIILRVSSKLKERLREEAQKNFRNLTGEVLSILEEHFSGTTAK
jgi:hypothetical protein